MSLRQLHIFIIFFGLVVFSLFTTVHTVQAVACNGSCAGSFTCDAGLSCVSSLCRNANCPFVTNCVCVPKTCSVSMTPGSYGNISVTLSGRGNVSGENVRLYLENTSATTLSNTPGGTTPAGPYDGRYYYYVGACLSYFGTSCSSTFNITNIPAGDYYLHCDLPTDLYKCSGNPFCNHERPSMPGGSDCTTPSPGWVSCSSNDNVSFSIVAPTAIPPTPTPTCPIAVSPTNLTPSLTCTNTVFRNYIWDAVPGATGYQFQLYVTNASGTYWCTNDGGVETNSYTVSSCSNLADTKTGTVTWKVLTQYPDCPDSAFTEQTYSVDKTAPPIPVPTAGLISNPACRGQYFVNYSWTAVNNTPESTYGCSALNSTPYRDQISADVAPTSPFTTVVSTTFDNAWVNPPAPNPDQTLTSYPPNTTLIAHVRSRDILDNQSTWSATTTITVPVPTPYPTIHIEGGMYEDIGDGTCAPMNINSGLTFSPSFSPTQGVSSVCTVTGSNYACDITINNQTGQCVEPSTTVTMNGTYDGYDAPEWRNNCDSGSVNLPVDISSPPLNKNLYLKYNPGGAGGWFKLKDTSFNSRQSDRQNAVPNYITKYDDEDDTTRNTLSGNSGLLSRNGDLNPGANARDGEGKPLYSVNNWYTNEYSSINDITYTKYLDYIKARKDFTTIEDLTEITTDGIYSVSNNVTLSDSSIFDGKNVVLVVQGTGVATFDSDFSPTNGSVAVLAKTINVGATVTTINAILIGQTVTMDEAAVGLKIKGNLISEDETGLELTRTQINPNKPSLFVVFDPKIYLDVLSYLSTSTYDWRQIQ